MRESQQPNIPRLSIRSLPENFQPVEYIQSSNCADVDTTTHATSVDKNDKDAPADVGSDVGTVVGKDDGDIDGIDVGIGDIVGACEGVELGCLDGISLGDEDGCDDGDADGRKLGAADGAEDGCNTSPQGSKFVRRYS